MTGCATNWRQEGEIIVHLSATHAIKYFNSALPAILGYKEDKLRGLPFESLVPDDERLHLQRLLDATRATAHEQHALLPVCALDGTVYQLNVSALLVAGDTSGQKGIILLATTQRAHSVDTASDQPNASDSSDADNALNRDVLSCNRVTERLEWLIRGIQNATHIIECHVCTCVPRIFSPDQLRTLIECSSLIDHVLMECEQKPIEEAVAAEVK